VYEELHNAVNQIAMRCDGAHTQDGVGFNGQDTKFGKRAAETPVTEWTPEIASEVHHMLRTYKNQLAGYGVDYDSLKLPEGCESGGNKAGREQAWKLEYARKNAPYVKIESGTIMVLNSYPIKDTLKANGFRFDPRHVGSKAWEAPLDGISAPTVLGMPEILLTDEQQAQLAAVEPVEKKETDNVTTRINFDICSIHPEHLQLDADFGIPPLAIVRALPGRKWDGRRNVNCLSPHIKLIEVAKEYNLTISDNALALIETRREEYEVEQEAKKAKLADSYATETEIEVALADYMRNYQRAGAAYMISHGNAMNADEMGLGKTCQTASALETDQSYPAMIVCPASLVGNWIKELNALLPHRVAIAPIGRNTSTRIMKADIYVVSYDVAGTYAEVMPMLKALVFDESQYLKNEDAQRTRACINMTGNGYKITKDEKTGRKVRTPVPGIVEENGHIYMLTGTPVLNRPRELVMPLVGLGYLSPFTKGEGSVSWFMFRYCHDHDKCNDYGHVFNAAVNREELHEWLRTTCMVRRSKKDVLTELPPKIRVPLFIQLSPEAMRTYVTMAEEAAERIAKANTRAKRIMEISALRKAVGFTKLEAACEWVNEFQDTGKSLVVFGVHKEVQNRLLRSAEANGIPASHIIAGDSTTVVEREKAKFQAGETKVIVVSFAKGQAGHTLTAASDVLLVESGWHPGGMDQAEDRCHRIGQTDSVTAYQMIAQDTIDEWLYELVGSKRNNIKLITEGTSVEEDESDIFDALIERMLSTYGGKHHVSPLKSDIKDEVEDKEESVTECEGCGEINLCTQNGEGEWVCTECII